ncbi:transcriptional regulator, TetR family [Monaibacterium marinum]|uniref:HTH-type transcriptional regulator BetI n=1 Tax=Pontivivens marinum TaxID=1690039 RepID=A0A2C9CW43_9RHOB|nr:transcriptional regulator BetI [Monaibacterium marinum]SOH95482.1 transcriptional regulator, TetR family [Monaibacterium marinum]
MPKIGMQPVRRAALVQAAIAEIGRQGSLDVTVTQIAGRAGVSSALAHHYFGSKERILTAAMRHILTVLGQELRAELAVVRTPRARVSAIVTASFSAQSFQHDVIAAWLAFYVSAQTSTEANRLLNVYQRRLRTNLMHDLRPLVSGDPYTLAETIASLIDGFYIRQALQGAQGGRLEAIAAIEQVIDMALSSASFRL